MRSSRVSALTSLDARIVANAAIANHRSDQAVASDTAHAAMIAELVSVVGEEYVISDSDDLLLYEYDGSIDRARPSAVVLPGTAQEVAECVKIANRFDAYVVPRGAGTGLSGGSVPLENSVVLPLTRLNGVLEVDPDNRVAVVEPGLVNIDLSNAVARYGLYYAPDPSSQRACTIGGNVAENAGGPHCLAQGVTMNHVLGVEVVLADGEIVWLGGKSRDTFGYDLRGAFIGSEGTLGIVTKVAVRLMPKPESVKTMLAAFKSLDDASQTVTEIIAAGMVPAALEMMDRVTIDACEPVYQPGYPEDAEAVLLVEVDGLATTVAEQSSTVREICHNNNASEIREAEDQSERDALWATRKGAIGAFGTIAPAYYLVDGVVPRTKLRDVMRQIREIGEELELTIGNVFHAGDGNLHPCILFDGRDRAQVRRVIECGERILAACVEAGGALSGEHGIGIEKQAYMPLVFTDDDMAAMAKLRPAFGAGDRFNPGKIFPGGATHGAAYGISEHAFRPTGGALQAV